MKDEYGSMLVEIQEMLKIIIDKQEQLLDNVRELKEEQKKLQEEIRINNAVLNSLPLRNEILN